jgi:acetyltransferase-like isoleucine patch superfamily enzyme
LLRLFGARVGREVRIHRTVRIAIPWTLTIDDEAAIGDWVQIYNLGQVSIGAQATISQGTSIPYSQVSAQGVQTAFQEAKLSLNVTPHVTSDGAKRGSKVRMSVSRLPGSAGRQHTYLETGDQSAEVL